MGKQIDNWIGKPDDFRIHYDNSHSKEAESRRFMSVFFDDYMILPSGNKRISLLILPKYEAAYIAPCKGSGIKIIATKPKPNNRPKGTFVSSQGKRTSIQIKKGERYYNYHLFHG